MLKEAHGFGFRREYHTILHYMDRNAHCNIYCMECCNGRFLIGKSFSIPTTQFPHGKSVQMFAKHLTHRINQQLQNPQILGVLAFYLVNLRIYIC